MEEQPVNNQENHDPQPLRDIVPGVMEEIERRRRSPILGARATVIDLSNRLGRGDDVLDELTVARNELIKLEEEHFKRKDD